jgi:SAM-dependent methyltransferase
LKTIPADTAQAGIAFFTGKNSKIRARKTEPCIDFKKDAEIECQSVPYLNAFLRFCSTIPNFLRQFPYSKSNSRLGGIGLSGVFQRAKLLQKPIMELKRVKARELAQKFLAQEDPLGWFEALYKVADGDSGIIPWADMVPNPSLVDWLDRKKISWEGKKALKIGCGLGDDAEELARRGFKVLAFDISQTAIDWCNKRFPKSTVEYINTDLFESPASWNATFDLVVESYTLQVLPPELRPKTVERISRFAARGGTLLVICRGRNPEEDSGRMPWPLTKHELDGFHRHGLKEIAFEDFLDDEDPPVRRYRVMYQRKI